MCTPDMIAWWARATREVMFFGGVDPEARELDGATYPHPALVFKVTGRELFVRALERNERPTGETLLKTAPYWNCDSAGRVCLGSMRVPDETTVESIAGWQSGFLGVNLPTQTERCGSRVTREGICGIVEEI